MLFPDNKIFPISFADTLPQLGKLMLYRLSYFRKNVQM